MRPLFAGIAAVFAAIGAGAIVAPKMSAGQFGLPTNDPVALACIRGMGARDLVIAAIVATSLNEPRALRRALGWASLVGLADALVVAVARGPRPQHAVHLAGFAGLVAAALSVRVPPEGP
ncbi:MAG: hypothetical protein NVS3B7_09600 [Candidatus Elarobacter sp.]